MTTDNSQFLMNKEHYVVNTLAMAIAIKYLCYATNQPDTYWVERIANEANEQCDQLTPQQIERSIEAYYLERNLHPPA
ncbi:hypothetical protein ACQFX9_25890 [Aliinostoc sp. HNIBRCY26]|uniref:hypothetical protein n=1 Tax=Aliinostoc sp. HNIBRCY26 TaxID=3418997 RepID=UPI003CFDCDAD